MIPRGWMSAVEKTSLALIGTVLLMVMLEEKFGWEVPGFGPGLFMVGAGVGLLGRGAHHVATGRRDHGKVIRSESPIAFWLVVIVADFGVAASSIAAGLWLLQR